MIPWYTSIGSTKRTVMLEVTGRKSGKPRRVSLSKTECSGQVYFVSLAGELECAHDVRAAGGKAVFVSGKRLPVCLVETQSIIGRRSCWHMRKSAPSPIQACRLRAISSDQAPILSWKTCKHCQIGISFYESCSVMIAITNFEIHQ